MRILRKDAKLGLKKTYEWRVEEEEEEVVSGSEAVPLGRSKTATFRPIDPASETPPIHHLVDVWGR
jgi:hypothetical protein